MTDDELRSTVLIEYTYINDLVQLEGFFVRCDFCMVSAFLFQMKRAIVPCIDLFLIWLGICFT